MQIDVIRSYPATDASASALFVAASTSLGDLVHSGFTGLIRSDSFPCIGARSAWSRNSYFLGVFDGMCSTSTTEDLGALLSEFIRDRRAGKLRQDFSTLIAVFLQPFVTDELQFEKLLWQQLQDLHDSDATPWSRETSSDPMADDFGFSYGGASFFLVGLHPGASRWSRRFPYPALTFNLHAQFEQLRAKGIFERFRDTIRQRDVRLQGSINPVLTDFGTQSEARQYSGRHVEPEWSCPLRPKQ